MIILVIAQSFRKDTLTQAQTYTHTHTHTHMTVEETSEGLSSTCTDKRITLNCYTTESKIQCWCYKTNMIFCASIFTYLPMEAAENKKKDREKQSLSSTRRGYRIDPLSMRFHSFITHWQWHFRGGVCLKFDAYNYKYVRYTNWLLWIRKCHRREIRLFHESLTI